MYIPDNARIYGNEKKTRAQFVINRWILKTVRLIYVQNNSLKQIRFKYDRVLTPQNFQAIHILSYSPARPSFTNNVIAKYHSQFPFP